jgi:hypothetical protein
MIVDVEICTKCRIERLRRPQGSTKVCPLCGAQSWDYETREAPDP